MCVLLLQEEDLRTAMAEQASTAQFGGEDLPDYQESGETAAGDFDLRPSTSRSGGEGTPMSDEPREETGEVVEDYQQVESISIGDDVTDDVAEEEDDSDDVIFVEVNDVSRKRSPF